MKQYNPPHPGEILREFFIPSALELSHEEIEGLLCGDLDVTEDIARKLSRSLGTTHHLWLNAQKHYDEWKRENEE